MSMLAVLSDTLLVVFCGLASLSIFDLRCIESHVLIKAGDRHLAVIELAGRDRDNFIKRLAVLTLRNRERDISS